jgi:hypothetical protein
MILLLFVAIFLVSCGGPVGGDSKSPVFLKADGGTKYGLDVDVYTSGVLGNVTDDFFDITITSVYKDVDNGNQLNMTEFAEVVIQEYRVTYYRVDGNPNVPDAFMVPCMVRVPAGGTNTISTLVLKREAKLKSPLKELAFGGGEGVIGFNAVIEFFGEDLIGNQVSTKYVLYIQAYDM